MQSIESSQLSSFTSLMKTHRNKGILMVLIGATLWGVSGTAAQILMQQDGFTVGWLVTVRMSISGILLLLLMMVAYGQKQVFAIWKQRKDGLHLILFGFVGLLGVQYSYFAAIQFGNAATATLLQYLSPALITVYLALRLRKIPTRKQQVAVILAFVGTALLVTNGKWGGLSISTSALVWGIISAFTAAFYTVYPKKLIEKYGAAIVVGWSMSIGGIPFLLVLPFQHFNGHLRLNAWLLVFFVVVFGTLIAFYLYMASLHYISAAEVSVLSCAEPLSAAVLGILFLNVNMSFGGLIGGVCIIGTVIILARA